MKPLLTLFIIVYLTTNTGICQNSDWNRDDRNGLYNECVSFLSKYPSLSSEQKESIGLCFLDEISKKYSKYEYQNKIEIELKKIKEASVSICTKNLGISLSDTPVPVQPAPIKKEVPEGPSKETLIGHWKDDNSEFWLFETGDYKMQYADGGVAKGTWKIDGDQLNLYKEQLFGTSEKTFKILMFTNEKFVYQSITNKKNTFTAVRLK
jgi:hypothetical protein